MTNIFVLIYTAVNPTLTISNSKTAFTTVTSSAINLNTHFASSSITPTPDGSVDMPASFPTTAVGAGVAVGVTVAIVILAAVVIIIVMIHRNKKRKKNNNENESTVGALNESTVGGEYEYTQINLYRV